MTYIDRTGKLNTKEFAVSVEEFSSIVEEKGFFECDELIAPTIQVLLRKGYKTKFCCQSHFRKIMIKRSDNGIRIKKLKVHHNYSYIVLEDVDLPYLPSDADGWYLTYHVRKEDSEGELIVEYSQLKPFNQCPFTNCKDSESIISLVKLHNRLTDLDDCDNTFDYNEKLIPIMRRLYEWAQSLPYRSAIEYN